MKGHQVQSLAFKVSLFMKQGQCVSIKICDSLYFVTMKCFTSDAVIVESSCREALSSTVTLTVMHFVNFL